MCVCVCVRACVRACVCECVRACVGACAHSPHLPTPCGLLLQPPYGTSPFSREPSPYNVLDGESQLLAVECCFASPSLSPSLFDFGLELHLRLHLPLDICSHQCSLLKNSPAFSPGSLLFFPNKRLKFSTCETQLPA